MIIINIWILDSQKGITLVYKSFNKIDVNEDLVSGLLAALNQFMMVEFHQPIESIDMGGLRWIYISEPEVNLLFVASDTKDINAEVLRSRLFIIKDAFFREFVKDIKYWEEIWNGNIDMFKPFMPTIISFYSQWKMTENLTSFADFFDILGGFQQILNLLRKIIEVHTANELKKAILTEIEGFFHVFMVLLDLDTDQELSNITFSKEHGFNLLNIDPTKVDIDVVKRQLANLLMEVVRILKNKIGHEKFLKLCKKERIFNYIFNNIILLKNLDLDTFLLQLILT